MNVEAIIFYILLIEAISANMMVRSREASDRNSAAMIDQMSWSNSAGAYGDVFKRRLRAMGIRDKPTAPRSPGQNGRCERLIGSVRRQCLDHVVVFGERHLRHVLLSYMEYYNSVRTHLSLNKDAPVSRAIQAVGRILPAPFLGGLHHQYVRI